MNRDERQKLGIRRWIDSGGRGVLEWATGTGKTNGSIMVIKSLYKHNPNIVVLVAVPTDVLKEQWNRELAKNQLFSICKVEIFNTIIKQQYQVDLLVVDECHLSASPTFINIYNCVEYKYLLGLTATWTRLDGSEKYLEQFMSVCDTITLQEALENNWVSSYRKYKVLLHVDMEKYWEYNAKFQQLFAYFNHDFKLVMELVKSPKKVKIWAQKYGKSDNATRGYLAQFMKYLKLRKTFVMTHPKKFEVANKILDFRRDKKCILFTATVKDAELFKSRVLVLHSQKKKKENRIILETFNQLDIANIVSPKALDAGVDVRGLSVGIALTCNSSQVTDLQRIGRVIRAEENKVAEFFTLVIAGSIEETWYNNANKNQSYITITEDQLDVILKGGEISTRPKKGIIDIEHRF